MTNVDYTKHDPDAICTPCDNRDPAECSLAKYGYDYPCECDCHLGFEKEEK